MLDFLNVNLVLCHWCYLTVSNIVLVVIKEYWRYVSCEGTVVLFLSSVSERC